MTNRSRRILVGALLVLTTSPSLPARPVIVFFGDSLTAGYGVEPEQAYPALIQEMANTAGYDVQVVNAGLSGETTAAGLRRIDWILSRPIDIFVLALGGNDGLRGIPVGETKSNLDGILLKVATRYPKAQLVLAGMESPPNMGETFIDTFRAIFPAVAEKRNALLIPFLLEGIGGEKDLNLPDGIHPNPEGHHLVAENVWNFLQPVIASQK
jgi:acyl-CoA thioesterase-1